MYVLISLTLSFFCRNVVVYTTIVDLKGNGEIPSVAEKKEKQVKLAHPNDISTSLSTRPHDTKTAGVVMLVFLISRVHGDSTHI